MSTIEITVSGPVGSGKSALCQEILGLCAALGVPATWEGGEQEMRLTHGDTQTYLEMYQPSVTIREEIKP